jgi:hypothetical protein
MYNYGAALLALLILTAVGSAQTKPAKAAKKAAACPVSSFQPACTLPFDAIKQTGLAIDKTCGETGCASLQTPEGKQNKAKNNFCATGSPVTITPDTLAQLQAAAVAKHIPFGSETDLPTDRNALQQGFTIGGAHLAEGMLVRMVAFIIETHYADLSSGESVNCKVVKATAGNDIHIALGTAYGADECTSVTAEMSPHFRPVAWNAIAGVLPKDKVTKAPAIAGFPIRVTGQLFFDASHKLCAGGQPTSGDPARQSLWEIHPVYAADVCKKKDLSSCQVGDESVWTPLDQWKPAGK